MVNEQQALILRLTAAPVVSLSDIARRADVSVAFISACAHGRRKPTRRVREAAEELLGYPAADLFPPWPTPLGPDRPRSPGKRQLAENAS